MSALNRIGLAAAVLAFASFACQSPAPPSSPVASAASWTFTSTTVQNHSHTVTIQKSEITEPPSGGISRLTSDSSGHRHTFAITEGQLRYIQAEWGAAVQIETAIDSGHSHTFIIGSW